MSSEDLKVINNILIGILNPDNTIRGEAEKKLEDLRSNSGALVFCLSKILIESQEKGVKTLASVLIRRMLYIKDGETVSKSWSQLDETYKNSVKENMIQAILLETNKNQKIKYCDTMASVAENVFESKEVWPDLYNFIYQGISLNVEQDNLNNIETVLFLMSQIFGYIYEELVPKLDGFILTFQNFFKFDNFDLKTRTSQVIGEILVIVKKKESKKFKIFIPFILEHTYKCLIDVKQESNLKLCLMAISDLAGAEPNILRKYFSDIFILMGKVSEHQNLEESTLRDLSFEIIVTLVESHPKLFSDDTSKLEVFIKSLFKYSLEMDMELTEEWTTPKTLSFLEEDVVPEPQLQLALGMIERLCDKIDAEKHILKILVSIVQELLGNDSFEWRFKYTAFMTITSMCEQIDDIFEITNILPTVFSNLNSEHPKIRFACLQVIEVASDQFNPKFQEQYHIEVTPYLLNALQDKVLRNQLQATETLNAFLENIPEKIAIEHCKSILNVLFPLLLSETTYVSLKENILNVLSVLVDEVGEEFNVYATECLEILIKVLSFLLNYGKEKSIYGSLLELITRIGPTTEEVYKKYIPDLINAMITLQNNIPYSTDPIFEYLHSAWKQLIPYVNSDFKQMANPIIECTLKLVNNVPTMSVNTVPEKKFDIQELLKDDTQDPKIVKHKIQLNTAETQDYAASISLLGTVIEEFVETYTPYLEYTEKIILNLLPFEINNDIRMEAANTLPLLLEIVKRQGKVELFHATSKNYLQSLILALEKETCNGSTACQLDAIGGIIEKTGMFLQGNEIHGLFVKLLEIFDRVEKSRLELIKKKEKTEEEFENDRQHGHNKINSDDEEDDNEEDVLEDMEKEVEEVEDVLVSIADIMGSMFKTHKELTLDVVNALINNLLPKYFTKNATPFETKMGLYIVDDMLEFLGQALLPHIWTDLLKLVLNYVDSKEPFLRQASVYGLGEFSVNTIKDYNLYTEVILEGIDKALRYGNDDQNVEQWNTARDNAVGALGKIIKYQNSSINVPLTVQKWVEYLPLNTDEIEAQKQHKIFVELLLNNCDLVIGYSKENLTKVLRILTKICDTKFVEDSTNDEIKKLIQGIKSNPQFAPYIIKSMEEANKEIKEKMEVLFK